MNMTGINCVHNSSNQSTNPASLVSPLSLKSTKLATAIFSTISGVSKNSLVSFAHKVVSFLLFPFTALYNFIINLFRRFFPKNSPSVNTSSAASQESPPFTPRPVIDIKRSVDPKTAEKLKTTTEASFVSVVEQNYKELFLLDPKSQYKEEMKTRSLLLERNNNGIFAFLQAHHLKKEFVELLCRKTIIGDSQILLFRGADGFKLLNIKYDLKEFSERMGLTNLQALKNQTEKQLEDLVRKHRNDVLEIVAILKETYKEDSNQKPTDVHTVEQSLFVALTETIRNSVQSGKNARAAFYLHALINIYC